MPYTPTRWQCKCEYIIVPTFKAGRITNKQANKIGNKHAYIPIDRVQHSQTAATLFYHCATGTPSVG